MCACLASHTLLAICCWFPILPPIVFADRRQSGQRHYNNHYAVVVDASAISVVEVDRESESVEVFEQQHSPEAVRSREQVTEIQRDPECGSPPEMLWKPRNMKLKQKTMNKPVFMGETVFHKGLTEWQKLNEIDSLPTVAVIGSACGHGRGWSKYAPASWGKLLAAYGLTLKLAGHNSFTESVCKGFNEFPTKGAIEVVENKEDNVSHDLLLHKVNFVIAFGGDLPVRVQLAAAIEKGIPVIYAPDSNEEGDAMRKQYHRLPDGYFVVEKYANFCASTLDRYLTEGDLCGEINFVQDLERIWPWATKVSPSELAREVGQGALEDYKKNVPNVSQACCSSAPNEASCFWIWLFISVAVASV